MCTFRPEDSYYQVETERLAFIPLTKAHIKQWTAFFVDNSTERFLGFEGSDKSSEEKAEFWIQKQIDRKNKKEFGQLAIIEKISGEFIGLAGIIPRDIDGKEEYEVTYSLLFSSWGKGYATEAAVKFKEYMLENTAVASLISIIHKENDASIKVAKKNEMKISSEMTFMEMPVYIFRFQ
tara:strand:- start:4795 stop:5331 length:537 start_codon:yes stop_codon:yes gene_type:complete